MLYKVNHLRLYAKPKLTFYNLNYVSSGVFTESPHGLFILYSAFYFTRKYTIFFPKILLNKQTTQFAYLHTYLNFYMYSWQGISIPIQINVCYPDSLAYPYFHTGTSPAHAQTEFCPSGFTTLINFLRGPQDTRNYYSDTCNPYMYIQPIHVHTTHTGCVFIHRWTPVYSKWTIMIPQWKLIYPNDTICINNILNEFYLSNS